MVLTQCDFRTFPNFKSHRWRLHETATPRRRRRGRQRVHASRQGPRRFRDDVRATQVAILVIALVSSMFFGFALSGLFFLGAAGVIYSIFLYGDLLKDLGPCGRCPSWLGGLERPSTPRGV